MYNCTTYNRRCRLINSSYLILLSLWGHLRYFCYHCSLPNETSRAHAVGPSCIQRIRTGSTVSYCQAAGQHGGTDGQLTCAGKEQLVVQQHAGTKAPGISFPGTTALHISSHLRERPVHAPSDIKYLIQLISYVSHIYTCLWTAKDTQGFQNLF